MHDAPAGRHLDRGGAVVRRELGAVAEPAGITGVTDGDRGADRPEPEQLRDRRARGFHCVGYPPMQCPQVGVEAADVGEMLER